jgi:hypothetical protein
MLCTVVLSAVTPSIVPPGPGKVALAFSRKAFEKVFQSLRSTPMQ